MRIFWFQPGHAMSHPPLGPKAQPENMGSSDETMLSLRPSRTLWSNGLAVLSWETHFVRTGWPAMNQRNLGPDIDFSLTNVLRHHAVESKLVFPLIITVKCKARGILGRKNSSAMLRWLDWRWFGNTHLKYQNIFGPLFLSHQQCGWGAQQVHF